LTWRMIMIMNEHGAWSIQGSTPTGVVLWVLWIGEAAIVLGVAMKISTRVLRDEVFCERCDRWCEKKVAAYLALAGAIELKQNAEAHDMAYFESLGNSSNDAAKFTRLDIHACPQCNSTSTMTVSQVVTKVDSKGKRSQQVVKIVDRLILNPGEIDAVKKIKERLTAAAISALPPAQENPA
jgi:hypothetical protein